MENTNNGKVLNQTKEGIRKKQVDIIKLAVQNTFEKLEELERQKSIIQDKIRIIKHDLYDLKDGRFDRVAERQKIANGNKNISAFKIQKIEGQLANVSHWYIDYELFIVNDTGEEISSRINNSILKQHACGTYKLKNGEIKYL